MLSHSLRGFGLSLHLCSGRGWAGRRRIHAIDMTTPHEWFPLAREMRRKVICHVGPTNSGKTFRALERLKSAERGVYCGPLRLLAWEVCNYLRTAGLNCDLVTGQELERNDESTHTACTIEMTDLGGAGAGYDCAVIDEFQVIGDEQRGWAWSRVFLGLQAPEIHVCGCPSFVPLLRKLCALSGDELEVVQYSRLLPLVVSDGALGDFSKVRDGDCVVAFSRKEIFKIKSKIEQQCPHLKCYVVYGNLPPGARKEQAELFNRSTVVNRAQCVAAGRADSSSGLEEGSLGTVLIASDAIGMGLNLSIKRIVFSTLSKFDGSRKKLLGPQEAKQIAGRAGRYFSGSSVTEDFGEVTCLHRSDLRTLRRLLSEPIQEIQSAGLFPSVPQLELLQVFLDLKLEEHVLKSFWSEHVLLSGGPPDQRRNVSRLNIAAVVMSHFGTIDEFRLALESFLLRVSPDKYRKKILSSRRLHFESRGVLGRTPLHELLDVFWKRCRMDRFGTYSLCNFEEKIELAKLLESLTLSFHDRCLFIMAPVTTRNEDLKYEFKSYASQFAEGRPVLLTRNASMASVGSIATTPRELLQLETTHQMLETYIWLGHRFESRFPDIKKATKECEICVQLIGKALRQGLFHQGAEGRAKGGYSKRLYGRGNGESSWLDSDEAPGGGAKKDMFDNDYGFFTVRDRDGDGRPRRAKWNRAQKTKKMRYQ